MKASKVSGYEIHSFKTIKPLEPDLKQGVTCPTGPGRRGMGAGCAHVLKLERMSGLTLIIVYTMKA